MSCCIFHSWAPCPLAPSTSTSSSLKTAISMAITNLKHITPVFSLCTSSFHGAQTTRQRRCSITAIFNEDGRAPASSPHPGIQSPDHSYQEAPDLLQSPPGTEMGYSIEGPAVNLLYGSYMDHLWVTLKENVPGLRRMELAPDYQVQEGSKARVHNWLLCANKLRRIRLTYFDGGAAGQAFNSLLYPDHRYNLPLLGIDLLSFGSNKILCVVDFQPLSQDPEYLMRHTNALAPVHARFRDKCGQMTTKFFDENQFFSKYIIFFRSSLGAKEPILQVPSGQLWEVYKAYLDIYLKALNEAQPDEDSTAMAFVKSQQDAYDQYNAERDPAIKLFNTYFGVEWSSRYTKDFLFPGATQ